VLAIFGQITIIKSAMAFQILQNYKGTTSELLNDGYLHYRNYQLPDGSEGYLVVSQALLEHNK